MFLDVFKNYTLWNASSEDYLKRDKRQIAIKKPCLPARRERFLRSST